MNGGLEHLPALSSSYITPNAAREEIVITVGNLSAITPRNLPSD